MKRSYLLLQVVSIVVLMSILVIGCSKDSSPTSPAKVTGITANGSFAPQSRTQVQGTMFFTDQNGQPLTNLSASNISTVLKWVAGAADSVVGAVQLQTLTATGKKIAVALTMDYSGSMYVGDYNTAQGEYQRILDMETGVKTFIGAMRTGDVAEIIKFSDDVTVVQPLTTNQSALYYAVDSVSIYAGLTALYQSIYQGLGDVGTVSSTNYARAVVAFTDGGENNSTVTKAQMLARSYSLSIPVYTVGLLDSSSHTTPAGQYWPESDLVEIADSTGGFYFYAPNAAQLSTIYSRISGQLSNAYVVTITWPSATLPVSGTQVTLTIRINYNGLTTEFTRTYIMP